MNIALAASFRYTPCLAHGVLVVKVESESSVHLEQARLYAQATVYHAILTRFIKLVVYIVRNTFKLGMFLIFRAYKAFCS